MKANKFFPVAWDVLFDPKIEMLGMLVGHLKVSARVVAVGLWVCLLSILYYNDGIIDLNKKARKPMLMRVLGLSEDDLQVFIDACMECDLVEPELYGMGHIVNHGVCDEIEYHRQKSEAGRKSGESRKKSK